MQKLSGDGKPRARKAHGARDRRPPAALTPALAAGVEEPFIFSEIDYQYHPLVGRS
jgi:hypothetical protein